MQLEHVEEIRCCSNARFYTACILVKIGLGSGFDLRNDREAVTRRGFRKDRSPLSLRKSGGVLRCRHRCWFDFHLVAPLIQSKKIEWAKFLLHLVEHCRKRRSQLKSFPDVGAACVGMFAIFECARPVVCTEKPDDGLSIRRVVLGPSLESLEGGLDTALPEEHR